MGVRPRRVERLAKRAVEKGLVNEARLKEALGPEAAEDLSSVIEKGILTHKQVAELSRDDESRPRAAAADEHEPGEACGKYILLKQLGSGGMGTVWLASDPALDRFVALKFLRAPRPEDVDRFQREARLAAKINHPNIAAVYEFADAGGAPYLAMQYIDGKTLLALHPPLPRTMKLVRDVARALDHAHRNGIVHRDLKPQNIMIDRTGRPYIMDFGLARRVSLASTRTPRPQAGPADSLSEEKGLILGTPGYISPEQVQGEPEDIDARTDIYGLGATLYHLLAGRTPFSGGTLSEILQKVITRPAAPPSKHNPEVPADADAIVLKCLQKPKARRYESAKALADDIDRFLRGEPVKAADQTVVYKLSKKRGTLFWIGTAAAAAAALIALSVLVLGRREKPDPFVREGEAALAAGRFDEAEAKFEQARKIDPSNAAANRGLDSVRTKRREAFVADVEAKLAARRFEDVRPLLLRAPELGVDPAVLGRWTLALEGPGRLTIRGAEAEVADAGGVVVGRGAAIDLKPGRYTARIGALRIPFEIAKRPTGEGEAIEWEIPPAPAGAAFMPRGAGGVIGTWIDRFEATNREYLEFLTKEFPDAALRYLYYPAGWELTETPFDAASAEFPVSGLDDVQAVRYLLAQGKRLPTRDEWLRAGQGIDGRPYPWGERSGTIETIDRPCAVRELETRGDVGPFGVVGLSGGAGEPVRLDAESGAAVFRNVAWSGGAFGLMRADPRRYLVASPPLAWSAQGGVRGARAALAALEAASLEKLMRLGEPGARAEAVRAAVALGKPELATAIRQAAWDADPFVAYPAIKDLARRGENLGQMFFQSSAPIGTLYLAAAAAPEDQRAEICAELERRYTAALKLKDRPTQIALMTALIYLGETGTGGRELPGEARAICAVDGIPNDALVALYLRWAFRPGTDIGVAIERLLKKTDEDYQWYGLEMIADVLGRIESGALPKTAFDLAARRARLKEIAESEAASKTHRANVQAILDRMAKLGL